MEKIPNLPRRKENPPHVYFEQGRQFGLYQAEKIVKSHIENIYPINCNSIVEELNATHTKPKTK